MEFRDTKLKSTYEGSYNTPNRGRYNPVYSNMCTFNKPLTASRQNASRTENISLRESENFQRSYSKNRLIENYCSLCGKTDHNPAQGCPYITNDAGTQIKIIPTLGTCQSCPAKIMPRLNHPSQLCPYRVGGPLEISL
jgi:hypothetical protein